MTRLASEPLPFIALDQSLSATGWVFFGDTLQHGVLRTSPSDQLSVRLAHILDGLENLVRVYPVCQVIREKVYFSPSRRGWPELFAVATVIDTWAVQRGLPIEAISANPRHKTSWRSLLKLSSDKGDSERYAFSKGYALKSHEADAFCIGSAFLSSIPTRAI